MGDSDCGETIKRGGQAALGALPSLDCKHPADAATAIAEAVGTGVGGTSGALYQLFFAAASAALRNSAAQDTTSREYAAALLAGVQSIQKHGKAREGDRTMVDALAPAAAAAVEAAEGAVIGICAISLFFKS